MRSTKRYWKFKSNRNAYERKPLDIDTNVTEHIRYFISLEQQESKLKEDIRIESREAEPLVKLPPHDKMFFPRHD